MSKYNSSGSYGHRYQTHSDFYTITWIVDWYYRDSTQRHPRHFSRVTDEAGVKRFCRRWGIEFKNGNGATK